MSVVYAARGVVATLVVDRPARRNAIDAATAELLEAALDRFEADPEARALVLSGAGGHFCAGADLKELDHDLRRPGGPLGFTRRTPTKPVVAAIEGACVAGGLELAAWCDIRVAAEGARFGCLERRWGVPLIDGGTQRLPRILGLGRALDLVLTGREFDVVEAERIGFVTRVVPRGEALPRALELAEAIASSPFACVLADRRALLEGLGLPLAEGLLRERDLGAAVIADAVPHVERFRRGAGRGGERA